MWDRWWKCIYIHNISLIASVYLIHFYRRQWNLDTNKLSWRDPIHSAMIMRLSLTCYNFDKHDTSLHPAGARCRFNIGKTADSNSDSLTFGLPSSFSVVLKTNTISITISGCVDVSVPTSMLALAWNMWKTLNFVYFRTKLQLTSNQLCSVFCWR